MRRAVTSEWTNHRPAKDGGEHIAQWARCRHYRLFNTEFKTVFLFSVCILDETYFRFGIKIAKTPTFQNTKF